MEIRPPQLGDAESALALHLLVAPFLATTASALRRRLSTLRNEPGSAVFAALDGDQVVGWTSTGLIDGSDPLDGQLRLIVHPEHRGRGAGTALLELAHENLKAGGAVTSRVFADPESSGWASQWGYRETRRVHYASMAPADAPALPPVPEGMRLSPLNEVDPHRVWEADVIAQRTKPGDAKIAGRSYESWLEAIWESPAMVLDLSTALLDADGRVIAFTLGNGDHEKIWSQMTATLPEYRGQGLGRLVKCAALHRAAEAGVTGMYTANYDGNGPMIAVNEWLGYTRTATHAVLIAPL
ncbi:GNAT family N-acetyltransferase [Kribbella sp. NPDC051770]|uniref:GNAT family N-acetyltransferase n=1 Tax=Kribbella sp. NPDC051770 TaxID=3155413 RepID=UPI00343CC11C